MRTTHSVSDLHRPRWLHHMPAVVAHPSSRASHSPRRWPRWRCSTAPRRNSPSDAQKSWFVPARGHPSRLFLSLIRIHHREQGEFTRGEARSHGCTCLAARLRRFLLSHLFSLLCGILYRTCRPPLQLPLATSTTYFVSSWTCMTQRRKFEDR